MRKWKWMIAAWAALVAGGLTAMPAAAQQSGPQERPILVNAKTYETDRFVIHYVLDGEAAVDPSDRDHNGTPDYIDEVAKALEYTWDVEINQMGWAPPPRDLGEGGDDRYDVYIENDMPKGIAGYAQSEGGYIGDNPLTPERERRAAYSFLSLDNDYAEVVQTGDDVKPLDLMRATVAHEFNHVIQAGYDDFDPQTWLYEATATWMEAQVYPDINDSRSYLPDILDAPDRCRTAKDSWYGSWLFIQHLSEKFGPEVVRSIWEHSRQQDGYSALDEALKPLGSSLIAESRAFAVANLLRAYKQGREYPAVKLEGSVKEGTFNPATGVQSLGADYVQLTGRGPVQVAFNGDNNLFALLIGIRGGEADTFDLSQPATVDLSAYQHTYVVVHNDEEALNEEKCVYRDYTIDVKASSEATSSATATLAAGNFIEARGGEGGSVTASGGGVANAGSTTYHPPYTGSTHEGQTVASSPQELHVDFHTIIPTRPPVGYQFDYAYLMTAADFGSSADYYVPYGGQSANFDYVSEDGNWMSITESPSPYDTLKAWLDGVGYAPKGDIQTIDGVEVLVEDLSDNSNISISASLIINGLFIVVDGDHSQDEVVALVQALIEASKPPEAPGGTQFPAPDLGSPAQTEAAPIPPIDTTSPFTPVMAYLGIGLCGLGACLVVGVGIVVVAMMLRRRKH